MDFVTKTLQNEAYAFLKLPLHPLLYQFVVLLTYCKISSHSIFGFKSMVIYFEASPIDDQGQSWKVINRIDWTSGHPEDIEA